MRTLPIKTRTRAPTVAIICPACDSQVSFDEIIEKEGNLTCVNCS